MITNVFIFLFGTMVGSFANVCIYRIPRDASIVYPRSMCVRCGSRVAFYDNIPILSWFILRGRCRACGVPYGMKYMWVEALFGLLALSIHQKVGLSISSIYIFVLASALVVASGIDLEHRIIPNSISISGTWIGLTAAGFCAWTGYPWFVGFKEAIVGALAAWVLLWGVGKIYEWITGREGIGMGDVKLLSLFGAHGGMTGAFVSLFYGSLLGSVVGLLLMLFFRKDRRYPIPFGPFLCAGFLIYGLYGSESLNWLLHSAVRLQ